MSKFISCSKVGAPQATVLLVPLPPWEPSVVTTAPVSTFKWSERQVVSFQESPLQNFHLVPISNRLWAPKHSCLFLESPPHPYLLANSNQSVNTYLKCCLFLSPPIFPLCSHSILYIPLSFTQQIFIEHLLATRCWRRQWKTNKNDQISCPHKGSHSNTQPHWIQTMPIPSQAQATSYSSLQLQCPGQKLAKNAGAKCNWIQLNGPS